MRLLVCGSRTWSDRSIIRLELVTLWERSLEGGDGLIVVHGAAPRGADLIAEMICDQYGIPQEKYPADWSAGRGAGFDRNIQMLDSGVDAVLAFHRDNSSGTRHTIEHARLRDLPVRVVEWPHQSGRLIGRRRP